MTKDKISYSKKTAETKLNHIKKNLNKKKVPVRIYEQEGKWFLTSKEERVPDKYYHLFEFFKSAGKSKDDKIKTVSKKIKKYFEFLIRK